MSFRPPSTGGSFTGGVLTSATTFNDDIPLYLGTGQDTMLRYNVAGFGLAHTVLSLGADSNVLVIASQANKDYDFVGNPGGPSGRPLLLFTSEAQNRNTCGLITMSNVASREFYIAGGDGDDIDGTARNANGISISLGGGEGGTLGGNGGNARLSSGDALFGAGGTLILRGGNAAGAGNDNGGGIQIVMGTKTGTGVDGYFITSGAVVDYRFKNAPLGKFKVLDSASEDYVGFEHDGTNAIYSLSGGLHIFHNQVSANQLVVGSETLTSTVTLGVVGNVGVGSGGLSAFKVSAAAHLDNGNSEIIDVLFDLSSTANYAGGGGAIASLGSFKVLARTFTADAAQTITTGSTVRISGAPVAGANITITNRLALWVEADNSRFDGNVLIGASAAGASMTKGISMGTGTDPSGNVTDAFQMYSADQAAGNAAPHFRTENGDVVKLFKSSAYSPSNVTTDRTYDANATTLDEVADVLGTLIGDLQATGLIG